MTRDEIARQMAEHWWWHSIDLGDGLLTPGRKSPELLKQEFSTAFDGLTLAGKRLLDIGAWNGAFSIEATRLGAHVTALDNFTWNSPFFRGRESFDFAVAATGCDIRAIDRDVDGIDFTLTDLGSFDVVLFLGVFYHLVDPIHALRRIRQVCTDVLVVETHIDASLNEHPSMRFYPTNELNGDGSNWWGPNVVCMVDLLRTVGFPTVEVLPGQDETRAFFRCRTQ